MKHVLKNGLIPVITMLGMHISFIFGGSVLIETVFNIPGMGRLMVSSVFAAVMLVVFAYNMVGDGLRDAIDPRLRGLL